MSNTRQENVITPLGQTKHRIARYEFRAIPLQDSLSEASSEEQPLPSQTPIHTPSLMSTESVDNQGRTTQSTSLLESGWAENILQKSESISELLLGMQAQLHKQQEGLEVVLRQAREEARALGFKEGQEQTRIDLQADIARQKEAFIESIAALDRVSKSMEQHVGSLENELSSIAVDIAKEVIAKEVSTGSASVAHALAKELLQSLKEATHIVLKLNPLDYDEVRAALEGDERVKIQPDKAIARGGVVMVSDHGNIDGSIASRFQMLKRSLLENLAHRAGED